MGEFPVELSCLTERRGSFDGGSGGRFSARVPGAEAPQAQLPGCEARRPAVVEVALHRGRIGPGSLRVVGDGQGQALRRPHAAASSRANNRCGSLRRFFPVRAGSCWC